jgi:hypothetical protein
MKILPEGAELFFSDRETDRQAVGQTDMMKLIVWERA